MCGASLPTVATVYRPTPKGGVSMPMVRFRTKMTPRCTGATPIAAATGNKMGVKIVKADIVSMNMPTNKTKRFISSKIKNGLSAMPRNAEVTISGKCSNVRTLVKNEATAIIIKILLTVLYATRFRLQFLLLTSV